MMTLSIDNIYSIQSYLKQYVADHVQLGTFRVLHCFLRSVPRFYNALREKLHKVHLSKKVIYVYFFPKPAFLRSVWLMIV